MYENAERVAKKIGAPAVQILPVTCAIAPLSTPNDSLSDVDRLVLSCRHTISISLCLFLIRRIISSRDR
jgi:hypothetical protein